MSHPTLQTFSLKSVAVYHSVKNKNSSGDEIANANFYYDDIVHVEASAYAH